jgi:hypothetical protein
MSTLRRLVCSAAVALGLIVASAPASLAQTASSDNADELAERDKQIRVVNAFLDAVWDVMDEDERAVLREIEVRIPMDYDMTRVIAFRDDGRVIELSFGFLGVLIELCDDWVLSEYYSSQDPAIYDKYEAYLTYLNDVIDQNDRSVGQEPVSPQPFATFAGIPAETVVEIMSQSEAQQYLGALRAAAIAFVVGHEIGHHMLGHVDTAPQSTAESRARESDADRYAAALTMRVGMPAFGALPALAIFTAMEGEAAEPDATHPLAACRILRAMMYTVDRLAEDPGSTHLFENSPDMRPGGTQYQALTTQMNQYCS